MQPLSQSASTSLWTRIDRTGLSLRPLIPPISYRRSRRRRIEYSGNFTEFYRVFSGLGLDYWIQVLPFLLGFAGQAKIAAFKWWGGGEWRPWRPAFAWLFLSFLFRFLFNSVFLRVRGSVQCEVATLELVCSNFKSIGNGRRFFYWEIHIKWQMIEVGSCFVTQSNVTGFLPSCLGTLPGSVDSVPCLMGVCT